MPSTEQTKTTKSDSQWREELSPEQYRVLREKGTEPAFTGAYHDEHRPGLYRCGGCGQPLFHSAAKFESGSGWPSFTQPTASENLEHIQDKSLGMRRTEVSCNHCGGHLGHVFDDGPKPTGQRYCINSAALRFDPET